MPADHTKNIIEVDDVSFFYGDQPVLEKVTLNIHEGDYLALIGPNGAGKTTLLKIMIGLLKPAAGRIRLFDRDIRDFKDHFKIAYVPQQTDRFDLNFPLTAYEVVALGRYGRLGIGRRLEMADKEAVRGALEQVGLWEQRDRLIGELSGGQKQRIFIARALAGEPRVIFLDEPARGLDHSSQEELYQILGALNRDQGITLVLVSHDIAKITTEAMHIACLDRSLVCHDSPADFLRHSDSVKILGTTARIIGPHHHDFHTGNKSDLASKEPDNSQKNNN